MLLICLLLIGLIAVAISPQEQESLTVEQAEFIPILVRVAETDIFRKFG